jgi:hypothetical protein
MLLKQLPDKGYKIHFALLPDKQIGYWDKFKGQVWLLKIIYKYR